MMFTETIRTHKKMKMMMLTQNISGLYGTGWLVGWRSMENNDPSSSQYPSFLWKTMIFCLDIFSGILPHNDLIETISRLYGRIRFSQKPFQRYMKVNNDHRNTQNSMENDNVHKNTQDSMKDAQRNHLISINPSQLSVKDSDLHRHLHKSIKR